MESTGPTGFTGSSEPTGDTGPTGVTGIPMAPYTEPVPDILTLDDLIDEAALLLAKEQQDGDALRTIGSQSAVSLKPKLVEWVTKGKPNAYPIMELLIEPPPQCSDGISRNLPDYIEFCSGKTIVEHVALLQAKLIGMTISFARISGKVAVVVSVS